MESASARTPFRNRLLARLSDADVARLRPGLEPIELPHGETVVQPGEPHAHLYFPERGIISVIAVAADGRKVEVGIYGREGFGPTSTLLGVDRGPHQHIVQVEGGGHRIAVAALETATAESDALKGLLMRYTHVFSLQTSFTALSNGSAVIGERLARWLLMCHDRIDGDELPLTHEFLSVMLSVRRPGVTEAVHLLEGAGIIRAKRGSITILDRERLAENAGDGYGVPEAEYARLIGEA